MYTSVKSVVRHINSLSDIFSSDIGLFQGQIMSPILFSFFLNDIEQHLQENIFDEITLGQIGMQWLSGRVLDLRPKGCRFEPHRRHCVVVLEQDTLILA